MTAPVWADLPPTVQAMPAEFVLAVRWPILDDSVTAWGAERIARTEWPAHVAEAGLWGTSDPVFVVEVGNQPTLLGAAAAAIGPLELRSHREAAP